MNLWTNPDDPNRVNNTQKNDAEHVQSLLENAEGDASRFFSESKSGCAENNIPDGVRHPRKRKKSGFLLLICSAFALVLAFALGMGTVFTLDRYTDWDLSRLLTLDIPDASFPNSGKPGLPDLNPGPTQPDELPEEQTPDLPAIQNTIAQTQTQSFPVTDAPRIKLAGVEERAVLEVGEIADRLLPSVVSVVGYFSDDDMDGYSLGTGTIYSADGYIITNYHVIEDAVHAEVLLSDGTCLPARHISSDETADIAILKIEADHLCAAEFGRSSLLRIGDTVVAIGNPASLELYGTTTVGRITGPERYLTMDSAGNIMKLLQTDASVNPGNSGGPLINEYGQVIGIVTAKLTADTYEGIGFAISSDRLEKIVADLLEYGYVTGYPMLGITGSTILQGEADGQNPAGVLVAQVSDSSGAAGKVLPGDVIYSCDGNTVRSIPEINAIKARMEVGDTMILSIYRSGIHLDVEIVLKDKYDID